MTIQPGARLSLAPPDPQHTADGVWWPRSADLEREILPLAAALARARAGRVERVLYDRSTWLPEPRPADSSEGRIETQPSGTAGPRQVVVLLRGGDRVVLRVIPATAPEAAAERAMRPGARTAAAPGTTGRPARGWRAVSDDGARPWFGTGGPAIRPPARDDHPSVGADVRTKGAAGVPRARLTAEG